MKIKNSSRFLLMAIMVVCAGYMISGCSSSTTPPTTTTNSNVYPRTGSAYTYSKQQMDSTGKRSGVALVVNANVTDSGNVFSGQSNTYTIISDAGDTTHYTYSGNNDVLTYIQNTGLGGPVQTLGDTIFHRWITLSVASKASGVLVVPDAVDTVAVTLSGTSFKIPANVHVVSDYVGSDSVRLATGESLFCQHCKITLTAVSSYLLIKPDVTFTNQRDVWFAAKIGNFAKDSTWTVIPTALGIQGSKGGSVQTLTSYNLK